MNERDRFDKFTERARKVLSFAQEEAQRFQHNYIGTEHLLLGLVRDEEGVAAKVLLKLGVELQAIWDAVEFIIGRGDRIALVQIGLTPRSKKVIELAVDEARSLNHHYIGTEHLLLGLLREGEGIAAGVLESLGVRLEQARRETLKVLKDEEQPMTADHSGMQEPFEPEFNFSKGQGVRIVEGPFTEFVGRVSESNRDQKKVTVLLSYFGKETPFVFDFLQVEKTEPFLS